MGTDEVGIGFFDSGIGGLTVLAACRAELKEATFYYYGDNIHAPYGNLSAKKIRKYVFRAFRRFQKLKVAAVVLACNTATAVCVESLRTRYDFPIVGVEPALHVAAKEGGEIFALSTRATYESERYKNLCRRAKKRYPAARITSYPCDGLAGAIEKNLGKAGVDFTPYLPRGDKKPDAVVLGCTHYPYIKRQIEEFYGCKTVDGNEGVARRLKSVLTGKNYPENSSKNDQNHSRPPTRDFCPENGGENADRPSSGEKRLLRQNINKRSFFKKSSFAETQETKGEGKIFFLGRSKKRNQIIFKQTFV